MFLGFPIAGGPLAWPDTTAPAPPSGPRTLRAAVRAMLAAVPGLSAAVGGRIAYAGSRQADVEPRITFIVSSETGGRDLDGPDGTREARVRVSSWSRDSVEAESLANRITASLDGYSATLGTVEIYACDWEGDVDVAEPPDDGGQDETFQIVSEFMIDHRGG